jgi:drug/metabolite transporter (DMT)-like permease
MMNKQSKADMALFIVTITWGSSYMLTKLALDSMSVYSYIAIRFGIAFLASAIIFHKRMMKTNREVIKYGVIVGLIMFSYYVLQTQALVYTTSAKSAFIGGLTVILVPVITSFMSNNVPEKKVIASTVMAFAGIGLLSFNGSIDGVNFGDLLSFIAAFVAAMLIMAVGKYTVKVDSVVLPIIQFGVVCLCSLVMIFIYEEPVLPQGSTIWFILLFLGLLCTSGAFIVQSVAMRYTSATHTALIFTCIPVFAAVFGYIFLDEVLTSQGILGAVLIVASMFIMELKKKETIADNKQEKMN